MAPGRRLRACPWSSSSGRGRLRSPSRAPSTSPGASATCPTTRGSLHTRPSAASRRAGHQGDHHKNSSKTAGPVGRVLFALAMRISTKLSKPENTAGCSITASTGTLSSTLAALVAPCRPPDPRTEKHDERNPEVPDRGDSRGRRWPGSGGGWAEGARRAGRRQWRPFAFDWHEFDWVCEYYARTGRMMAEDGLTVLEGIRRHLLRRGRLAWRTRPHTSGLRLAICQNFDLWANVRPVRFLPGVRSPLGKADHTELELGRRPGEQRGRIRRRWAAATCPGAAPAMKSPSSQRCSPRSAANASCASPSIWRAPVPGAKVSSVTKSNAQQYGMVLWDDVFRRVATDYPDVETESVLVDAMAAKFVLHPRGPLPVVVASQPARGHPVRPRQRPRREPRPGRQRQP